MLNVGKNINNFLKLLIAAVVPLEKNKTINNIILTKLEINLVGNESISMLPY